MRKSGMLSEEGLWQVIDYMTDLNEPTLFMKICEELKLNENELNQFICFFKDLKTHFVVKEISGHNWVIPPSNNQQFHLNMSLSQWLKFQAHFPKMAECSHEPFHSDIETLLARMEYEHEGKDLFEALDNYEGQRELSEKLQLQEDKQSIQAKIYCINDAIVSNKSLNIELSDKREVFPLKLVKLNGVLTLIYESIDDGTLRQCSFTEIKSLKESQGHDFRSYSDEQVAQFIKQLREMDDLEERLILKVLDPISFTEKSLPQDEFFRNEVIVESSRGYSIWAASVELNESIHEWILSHGSTIEILGSDRFKQDYLKFCQLKLKKLA